VDFVAETAGADADYVGLHLMLRTIYCTALCVSDQVAAGLAQADRIRALAADSRVDDTARASALHAFAISRAVSEDNLEEALEANSESISLFAALPAPGSDLDAARRLRIVLLELAGRDDEAARLRSELD
jgi:hypothetical protein